VVFLTVNIRENKCCSCDAGSKLGSGIFTYLESKTPKLCGQCPSNIGCVPEYKIIPLDFIIISTFIILVGLFLILKNKGGQAEPMELEKPKEE
jgi:hypothetical protein